MNHWLSTSLVVWNCTWLSFSFVVDIFLGPSNPMGVVWYQLCAWTSPEVGHQLDCVCWWITWNAQCRLKQWLNSDHLSYYSLMSRNTCNQDLGYFILPVHTTDCNFPLSSVGIACGKVRIWVRGDFVMSIIKSMNFTDVHFWTYLYQQTDLVTPQLHWISGGKLGHLSVSSWYIIAVDFYDLSFLFVLASNQANITT